MGRPPAVTGAPGAVGDTATTRRDTTARVLHGVVAACAVAGVGIEVARALAAGDAASAQRLVRLVGYFTIWTNVLVAGVSTLLVIRPRHDGPVFRALRLDTLLFVVVTAVTAHLVLAPYTAPDLAGRLADVLTHTVVPLATVVVWAAVGPRPRIAWRTCADALLLPAVWLVWTFVRGPALGWYPYPFLDAERLGTARALAGAGVVVALGTLLGAVLRGVDRTLPNAPR
ncbi:Pr6Pr family membrane protein [Cellulomonas dongxiuzhuiae]|uniref:Pr6Pr family membrane protein n=1 Tax=Cellulomonas dongxiuzhuiae TaxID=2819979 RepID=UPI001AAE5BD9|nr:Pr6Pr family membrane protein [Cellulomonas dongxiuzhuiae]MBO3087700.1 Pr6Pr family membrane protein [Cellulomonas dongxiuzhuiae]